MFSRKGFTLIELMVVILIVAILAAVAIPIMRGRIDAAKWSEGKAIMGTIATGIRAYVAEKNKDIPEVLGIPTIGDLGFLPGDLSGTYFDSGLFSWTVDYKVATNSFTYTITANAPADISWPDKVRLIYDNSVSPPMRWEEGAGGP